MIEAAERLLTEDMANLKNGTAEKPQVFKSKSKKDKSDCLNIRKTLLGTSPKLVILKSAEDLCLKKFDFGVGLKKQKTNNLQTDKQVNIRLLNSENKKTDASKSANTVFSVLTPNRPSSFCCKYIQSNNSSF